ncbi:MAG: DUF348 domain-containing protein [Anaerolineales bacterium]|nr:DUF348 domain-containing protein [Anaerolineales bacterium]
MKFICWLVPALLLFLSACQPNTPRVITVLDGETTLTVTSAERIPNVILREAGISLQPEDRVWVNGILHKLDEEFSARGLVQLQIQRAMTIRLVTPQGEQTIRSSALTVGDVLKEAGYEIGINDEVNPPLSAPVVDSLTIEFFPARELTISSGESLLTIRSAARTVGEALAEAGIPLMGLDVSSPAENEALPADGQIRVTRVTESISVELESIPFETETTISDDVAFGDSEVLQPGVNGVTMIRTRVRYENGVEVSREVEGETVLQESQTQIVASGSKIVLEPVGGEIPYQYWFATQMYASWYSPCNSGTGGCSYGTASGARAGYGIVAVDYAYYSYLAGMRVYIPGYGVATIGDTGGGPIIETQLGVPRYQWIDLGYDDNNIGGLSGWVTVYFLEPAPAEIPYFFQPQ